MLLRVGAAGVVLFGVVVLGEAVDVFGTVVVRGTDTLDRDVAIASIVSASITPSPSAQ